MAMRGIETWIETTIITEHPKYNNNTFCVCVCVFYIAMIHFVQLVVIYLIHERNIIIIHFLSCIFVTHTLRLHYTKTFFICQIVCVHLYPLLLLLLSDLFTTRTTNTTSSLDELRRGLPAAGAAWQSALNGVLEGLAKVPIEVGIDERV